MPTGRLDDAPATTGRLSRAQAAALERLRPDLVGYAVALCGSRHDADDLVQEAHLRALGKADSAPPVDRLKPWLYRIVRNLHVDGHRRRRVREEYAASLVRHDPDIAICADRAFDSVLLTQALAALDDDKREIVYLVDVEGCSYAEAAALLEVPVGTVMSRISRARRALLDVTRDDAAPAARSH